MVEKVTKLDLYFVEARLVKGRFSLVSNSRTFGFIVVELESGKKGVAEIYSALHGSKDLIITNFKFLFQRNWRLELQNPRDFLVQAHRPFVSRTGMLNCLLSSLDLALWDAYLKSTQTTLSHHTGVKNLNPKVYGSGGSNLMSENEIMQEYENLPDFMQGYKFRIGLNAISEDRIKIHTFGKNSNESRLWMVDGISETANNARSVEETRELVDTAFHAGATWFEEPFSVSDFTSYKELSQRYPKFITVGENFTSNLEFLLFQSLDGILYFQPDITHNFHISRAISESQLSKPANVKYALHCWGSKFSYFASLKFAQNFPGIEWIEYPLITYDIDDYAQELGQEDFGFSKSELFYTMLRNLEAMNRVNKYEII